MRKFLLGLAVFLAGFILLLALSGTLNKPHHPRYAKPPYRRVVSLSPALTDNIYLLGMEGKLIGVTSFRSEQAAEKEVVGTLIQPNIEKITALDPDVILATKEGNRRKPVERLISLGFNVEVFDSCRSFSDICSNFVRLGELLGARERALELARQARERVDRIVRLTANAPKRRVFWQVGSRPLITVGQGTFVCDFIRLAGGVNIFGEIERRFPRVSREEVVRRDPEVIIIAGMRKIATEEIAKWRKFTEIDAVRKGMIFALDPDDVCRPSPLRFAEGLEQVARCVHPEVFERDVKSGR